MSATNLPKLKCGGTTTSGLPCRRDVPPGFTRCHVHGGASPAAKIKAEQALAHARMPAIEALNTIIDQFNSEICPQCKFPSGEAAVVRATIRACEVVLDRTGMPARSQVEVVSQSDGDFTLAQLTAEERTKLSRILGEMRGLKAEIKARLAVEATMPVPADAPPVPTSNTVQ